MSAVVAERFVDAVLQDGWLVNPSELLSAMREPPVRNPAPSSLAVADAISSLDDASALTIIRSVLDSAYFSMFALMDAGFKNSGLRVQVASNGELWDSCDPAVELHDTYRDRVEPNGFVRKPS